MKIIELSDRHRVAPSKNKDGDSEGIGYLITMMLTNRLLANMYNL